jgi:DnaJ-class molecular chaperone
MINEDEDEEVCDICRGYGSNFVFYGPEYDWGIEEPCIKCEGKGIILITVEEEDECNSVQ